MKKVQCFVTYRKTKTEVGFHIMAITVKTRENNIIALPVDEKAFQLFHDMYESVMKTLAHNHMRVHGWDEFGARWYDVMWCDLETGKVERYAYKGLAR